MYEQFSTPGTAPFAGHNFISVAINDAEFPDTDHNHNSGQTQTNIRQRLRDGLSAGAQTWNEACGGTASSPQPTIIANSNLPDVPSIRMNYHPGQQFRNIRKCFYNAEFDCYSPIVTEIRTGGIVETTIYRYSGDEENVRLTLHQPGFWESIGVNMAHEIGHALALDHDQCPGSIMDGNAFRLTDPNNDPQITQSTCDVLHIAYPAPDPLSDLLNDGASCSLFRYCEEDPFTPWPRTFRNCYTLSSAGLEVISVTEPDGTTQTTTRQRNQTYWSCLNFPSFFGLPEPPDLPPVAIERFEGPRVMVFEPANGARLAAGPVEVRGWAWGADFPLGEVEVYVDGNPAPMQQFQHGFFWPDACDSDVDPEYCSTHSGFSGYIDTTDLEPGFHTLQVGAVDTRDPNPLSVGSEQTFYLEANEEADAAQLMEFSIPEMLGCGETRRVWITLLNTGSTTWERSLGFELGWGADGADPFSTQARLSLPPGVRVAPGEEFRFAWMMTAPNTAGNYTTDWQMIQGGQWFGEAAIQEVEVSCHMVTRLPVADAYVTEDAPNENRGLRPYLGARDDDSGISKYAFLRFDLSSVSRNIVSARLKFRTRFRTLPLLGVYELSDMSWSEVGVTWYNWQVGEPTHHWLGTAYNLGPNQWHSIDVSSGVRSGAVIDLGVATSIDEQHLGLWSRESLYSPILEIVLEQ